MSVLRHKHLYFYQKYWDFDGDGYITWVDFDLMAEKYAVYQRRGKYEKDVVDRWKKIVKTWWDSLSSAADTNKDAKVDFDEWLKYFDNLSNTTKKFSDCPEFLQTFTQLYFVTLDYNKDGLFDIKDYRQYLANYNMDVTRAEECFQYMLNEADIANGSKMSRERFNYLFYDFLVSKDPNSQGKYMCGPFDSYKMNDLEQKLKKK
ncbi:sterol carrier protein 2 [Chamberlinius hualienensis]